MLDGLWLLIVRNEKAFVPTMAQTEAGLYMGVEPVEVIDTRDKHSLEQALLRVITRGNPQVPTPTRANFPEDPLLKHAKVKSISTFERSARRWQLTKRADTYEIVPHRPGKYGGTVEDRSQAQSIPVDAGIEAVVHRLVERAING